MADYRDRFENSHADVGTVGDVAAELHESDAFEADLSGAVRDVLREHLTERNIEMDTQALAEFEDHLVKNGTGGLVSLRNGTVTNREVGLEGGEAIRMELGKDDGVAYCVVVGRVKPDRTRTPVWMVTESGDGPESMTLAPGMILYDDRYELIEVDSDARPFTLAMKLLWDLKQGPEVIP